MKEKNEVFQERSIKSARKRLIKLLKCSEYIVEIDKILADIFLDGYMLGEREENDRMYL